EKTEARQPARSLAAILALTHSLGPAPIFLTPGTPSSDHCTRHAAHQKPNIRSNFFSTWRAASFLQLPNLTARAKRRKAAMYGFVPASCFVVYFSLSWLHQRAACPYGRRDNGDGMTATLRFHRLAVSANIFSGAPRCRPCWSRLDVRDSRSCECSWR